jgi:hypothetical protein
MSSVGHDKRHVPAHGETHPGAEHHGADHDHTRFTNHGPVPAVAAAGTQAGASASDRAYGSPAGAMPREIGLEGASATVQIPARRKLAGDWKYEAQTRDATSVTVAIDHNGFRISMSPGIYLDVTWPGRDCEINGVSMAFGGSPRVDVSDGGGFGVYPVTGMVSGKVSEMLQHALAGTRLADRHYDPLRDTDLSGTVQQLAQGFAHQFGGGGAQKSRNGVGLGDITARGAGADVSLNEPIQIGKGVQLAAGATAHLEAMGVANLASVAAGHTNQERADAVHFDSLVLTSPGIEVNVDGKPIARIQQVTFHRGGAVTVERMTALGKLDNARKTESTLAAIGALIMLAAGDHQHAGALADDANNPRVVDGVAAHVMEKKLEEGLKKLILRHDHAISGVSLAGALGLH